MMFPSDAFDGKVKVIALAVQPVTAKSCPPNVTVPDPCGEPKFAPLICTEAPSGAELGDKLLMLGAGRTVNPDPLLFTPSAFTITFPVVAAEGTVVAMLVELQLVIAAIAPLKLTVPLPWVVPKFVPVIVTAAPAAPEVTDRPVMLGGGTTVKLAPLLSKVPT